MKQAWNKVQEITSESIEYAKDIEDIVKPTIDESLKEIADEYQEKLNAIYKCIELLTIGSKGILQN